MKTHYFNFFQFPPYLPPKREDKEHMSLEQTYICMPWSIGAFKRAARGRVNLESKGGRYLSLEVMSTSEEGISSLHNRRRWFRILERIDDENRHAYQAKSFNQDDFKFFDSLTKIEYYESKEIIKDLPYGLVVTEKQLILEIQL